MVAKQLPQATFRISDNELWESFKLKAKNNGANASAIFWQFAKDYVDGNLDSRIDSPDTPNVDIESIVNDAIAPILARLEALENRSSEATAPANFTQALLQRAKEVAPLMLQKAS